MEPDQVRATSSLSCFTLLQWSVLPQSLAAGAPWVNTIKKNCVQVLAHVSMCVNEYVSVCE